VNAAEQRDPVTDWRLRGELDGLKLYRAFEAGSSWIWIYRPESGSGPGVVVKKLVSGAVDSHAAQREFGMLSLLEQQFSRFADLHVPHPITHFGDQRAVLTREIMGDRVDRLFVKTLRRIRLPSPSSRRKAASVCDLIGRWIRALHDSVDIELLGLPMALGRSLHDRYDAARHRLADLRLSPGHLVPAFDAYFSRLIEDQGTARPVLCHPDFTPHNMIVAVGGLYVLDVSEIAYGHPLEDVAFFWAHLEALRLSGLYERNRIAQYQKRFLGAAIGTSALPNFWERWGVLMRLSYLSRSWEHAGKLRGINLFRRNMARRSLQRWLLSQPWDVSLHGE